MINIFPLTTALSSQHFSWVELSAYRVGAERVEGGGAGPVMGVKPGQKSLLANTHAHLRERERARHIMVYFFSSEIESAVSGLIHVGEVDGDSVTQKALVGHEPCSVEEQETRWLSALPQYLI